MAKTTLTNFKLLGMETLSSYAAFTLEGQMSAKVKRGKDVWTISERNGVAKGTSDGESEAIYIPNAKAIKSIEKNIVPLLPKKVEISNGKDLLSECLKFDLKLISGAGKNKKKWGGNATLASSTVFFQTLLQASGISPWKILDPKVKKFSFPNIAYNMVCGGEHVPGTKQDIQEMFFFSMKDNSIKANFTTAIKFFKQFEKNLVRDGLPTGTAKERGFVFPVKDNFEGLKRIKECATQLGLNDKQFAMGTDNAFSELQKTEDLRANGKYDLKFSGGGIVNREKLIDFNGTFVDYVNNFVTMEDPGGEHDIKTHKMMNEKYGDKVQVVIDDAAVTQMRFIIPFLASPKRKERAGNSILIKLNQAGTFSETRLASEVVLGLADPKEVIMILEARGDIKSVLSELKDLGIDSIEQALENIKKGGYTAFFSHRSTEGSSEFLSYLPLMYGAKSQKIWFKAGAPNGERNLQNYNPLIRAEIQMKAQGIQTSVTNWKGLPKEVKKRV